MSIGAARAATALERRILLVDDEDALREVVAAMLRLWRSGYVEPVAPERAAFHVLAQQLLALCLQEDGVPVVDRRHLAHPSP